MDDKYEAIFIIKHYENEDKIKEVLEIIDNLVKTENCKIFLKDKMGERKLAYDIKGNKIGYFYLINFQVIGNNPNVKSKISLKINTLEEVLKHMILKINE